MLRTQQTQIVVFESSLLLNCLCCGRVRKAKGIWNRRTPTVRTIYPKMLSPALLSMLAVAEALVITSSQTIETNALAMFNNSSFQALTTSSLNSISTSTAKGLSEVRYTCDGATFGYDLHVASCSDALRSLSLERHRPGRRTWGPRGTGSAYDYPIPQRWVSRKSVSETKRRILGKN